MTHSTSGTDRKAAGNRASMAATPSGTKTKTPAQAYSSTTRMSGFYQRPSASVENFDICSDFGTSREATGGQRPHYVVRGSTDNVLKQLAQPAPVFEPQAALPSVGVGLDGPGRESMVGRLAADGVRLVFE